MEPNSEKPAVPRSLIKKLAEVMGEVERVPKNGTNAFHNYQYATEADIAAAVRSGMAKRFLMLVPNVDAITWTTLATKSGSQRLCTMNATFTVMDGESGESISYKVISEGADSGDKAVYKAMTGAEKYALLKLFLIPTGDDPEKDSQEAAPAPPKTAEAAKARTAAAIQKHAERHGLPSEPHVEFDRDPRERPQEVDVRLIKTTSHKADDKGLAWAIKALAGNIADPAKARYHETDRKLLAHLQAEANWRANGAAK